MRNAITNLITAAGLNFGVQAAPSHIKAATPFSDASSRIAHLNPFQDANATMTSSNAPLFTGSQLARAEFANDSSLIDAVDVVFCDHSVQRTAAHALAKLTALNDLIGLRSEMARAIDGAMGADCDVSQITPESVIQALNRRIAEIDSATFEAKADKVAHNGVNKARRDRLAALNAAVNKVAANLTAERDALIRTIDSFKFDSGGVNEKRFRELRGVGLSLTEINSLNVPRAEDREATEKVARERIAEITTLLPKCKEFWDDPWRRTEILAGLGLDTEIARYEACRAEPYEVPA